MDFILVAVLFGTVLTAVNSELHSLSYIYTALSKPVDLPGIHEFTAMGLLDGRMIDYYDSKLKKKVPKQRWMEERLEPDYWSKGTTSRQSKEHWFKVNVEILRTRMRQTNDTELHSLQWSHGCEVDIKPDGSKRLVKGTDHYSYDGDDFLSFDGDNSRWIAAVPEAVQTKTKWDSVVILNQYTNGYLNKECVDWLEKFLDYQKPQLANASLPNVHVFSKAANAPGNVHLICLATGFYPKDVVLEIRRDNKTLVQRDGIETTGVRPNGDDTFQVRTSVEIREDDDGHFECYVIYSSLPEAIVKEWKEGDKCGACKSKSITPVIAIVCAVVGFVLATVAVVIVVLLRFRKKTKKGESTDSGQGSRSSLELSDSGSIHDVDVNEKLLDPEGKGSSGSLESSDSGNIHDVDVNNKLMDPEGESTDRIGSSTDSGQGSRSSLELSDSGSIHDVDVNEKLLDPEGKGSSGSLESSDSGNIHDVDVNNKLMDPEGQGSRSSLELSDSGSIHDVDVNEKLLDPEGKGSSGSLESSDSGNIHDVDVNNKLMDPEGESTDRIGSSTDSGQGSRSSLELSDSGSIHDVDVNEKLLDPEGKGSSGSLESSDSGNIHDVDVNNKLMDPEGKGSSGSLESSDSGNIHDVDVNNKLMDPEA